MAGLLDLLGGGGNTGGVDLNQLVRPPDPLGAALAEMSQRFATAGQASRLPVSTLGAIGSALGGAGAAAQTQQTQYLDQAIKLQALKRSLQQMGITQQAMDYVLKQWALQQGGGGAAPGTPAVPQVAPGAPAATPGPTLLPGDVGANYEYGAAVPTAAAASPGFAGFTPSNLPPGSPGTVTIDGKTYTRSGTAPLKTAGLGLLGNGSTADASGLDSVIGGPGAGAMLASFRPESLVGSTEDGAGSGSGVDPLDLISKYESDGRNIRQQVVPESVSSASGPWQMLDSTFHETAKKAGIDVNKYDSAKDAPIETQRAVAQALYNEKGFAPWANYNPKLAAAIGGGTATGGTASPVSTLRGLLAGSDDGGSADPLAGLLALASRGGGEDPLAGLLKPQDEVIPSGGGLPAGLLQKAALGAGNAGYPIPNILPPGGNAAFPALPATGDNQIPIAGPGAPDTVIPNDLPADAQQVGDRLIGGPSTRRPGMMMAQYAPGGPAAAGAPAASGAPVQGAFPPLVGPGSGTIPGLGMTPAQVALANTMFTLGGTNSPLKEFLDVYYKSPEYLRQSAQATQQGQTAVTGPAQILLDQAKAQNDINVGMAKDHVMIDPYGSGKVVPIPGYAEAAAWDKNKIEEVTNKWQTELAKTQAGLEVTTVPVLQSDGRTIDTPMTRLEFNRRQAMQGNRAPQPGDIVGKEVLTPSQEDRNKAAQADFNTNVTPPFQAGQKALFALTQIENALQNYQTGAGKETLLDLQKRLSSFADAANIPQTDAFRKSIASGEIIRKSGNALGFELANSLLGKGESGNVVNQAIQSNPGLSVSPTGNQQLISLIKQGIQRDFDKHAFYNNWFDKRIPGAPGGTFVGADDAFNRAYPVDTYVNRVLPKASSATPMAPIVTPYGTIRPVQ